MFAYTVYYLSAIGDMNINVQDPPWGLESQFMPLLHPLDNNPNLVFQMGKKVFWKKKYTSHQVTTFDLDWSSVFVLVMNEGVLCTEQGVPPSHSWQSTNLWDRDKNTRSKIPASLKVVAELANLWPEDF